MGFSRCFSGVQQVESLAEAFLATAMLGGPGSPDGSGRVARRFHAGRARLAGHGRPATEHATSRWTGLPRQALRWWTMWSQPAPEHLPAQSGAPFTVLAVCTGNICRSPAVERLLQAALGDDSNVVVSSAGTHALVGHGIAEPMARLLEARGADPGGFEARQLVPALPARADLVIALTREHRSALLTIHPRALRRTFTLRELARLSADVDSAALPGSGSTAAERLSPLVPLAAARRGYGRHDPMDDDVIDPWRRSDDTYEKSMRQIVAALDQIMGVVNAR